MKKTFLQMINEFAPAREALANVGKQIVELPDGTKKIVKANARSGAYKAFISGVNDNYRKIIKKFNDDPAFKNQIQIIRKNNVFYLNRMFNLIKSQDPSIESLTQIFSKTKNDAEFFSHMNSFIVPLSAVAKLGKKIQFGDLWEDDNFTGHMRNNGFEVIMPKNKRPNENNVMIRWGKSERSISDFTDNMKLIISNYQKYEDLKDAIAGTNQVPTFIYKTLFAIKGTDNENTLEKLMAKAIEPDVPNLLPSLQSFMSSLKYPKDSKIVIGLEKINDVISEGKGSKFDYPIFKEILSGDDSDDIGFIFKDKQVYQELNAMYKSVKPLRDIFQGYSESTKKIFDASFIQQNQSSNKKNYIRSSFINGVQELYDVLESIKVFGVKFYKLKKLIKTLKKAPNKEIAFSNEYKDALSLNIKDLGTLYARVSQIIIRLRSMLRVAQFFILYADSQFHNQLDVNKMSVDNEPEFEDYFVYVGIVPEDVMAQSTYQFWVSCQTLTSPTTLNQYVGSGTLLGNIVCFLLALDFSKPTGGNTMKVIKGKPVHSAITDPKDLISIEEFKELASKGIQGTKKVEIRKFLRSYAIRPIGRVLIKTFELDDMGRGISTIKPETVMQGGSEEEIETIKFVDRLYTREKNPDIMKMITSKGTARGEGYSKYGSIFYKSMQNLAKRLNFNVKVGNYKLRDDIYNDGVGTKNFSEIIKKYELGKQINFSQEDTQSLLTLLNADKNFLKYRSFRHALFSKDRVDGTLDLVGSSIVSLDPMHATNLPQYGAGLPDDRWEDFTKMNWMVNDNFRKDSGDFTTPLTKSEKDQYVNALKRAKIDNKEFSKKPVEIDEVEEE
jgi:hypothetical protein